LRARGLSQANSAQATEKFLTRIVTRLDDGQQRYRLLDTTRAYALEKLDEHDELDVISGRHAKYVAEFLESQGEMMLALPRARRTAAYSDQLSNIRAALEWNFGPHGDDEIATRLVAASAQVLLELSLLIECQTWAERAIARLGTRNQNSRRAKEIYALLPLALMHTEGNDRHVRASFSRALEIATNHGDLAYELRLLSGLFMYSHWTMDIRGATDIAARSKKLALKTGDPDDMALAESMLAAANHLLGNHIIAQQHCEAGLRYSGSGPRFRAGEHLFHYTSILLVGMARSLLYRGLLDRSLEYAKLAIEEGEKSGHPATFCRSLALIVPVFLTMADTRRSDQYIAELSDLSAAHSLKPYGAIATGLRGQWLLLQDNLLDAISLLKKALEELHDQHQEMLNTDFVCDLAAALMKVDEHEQALRLVLNAIDVQQRVGKFLHMPALFRMKGLILVSRSDQDYFEAEGSLRSSIDWAKRQSATLFELRAATDLAELLLKQGRVPEAYKHLGAALDRMPAGIISPDHARALQILSRPRSGTEAVG
jgi:predicted ATPase